jgi:hypothetical protein
MLRRNFLASFGLGAAAVGVAAAAPRKPFAKPPTSKTLDAWRNALAAARLREIARLASYRDAGWFPRNHRVLGSIPTFIDPNGAACAVGYLMQQSGHAALAADIARTDNHVYIEKITDGPALEWILHSGLTQEECAFIQPSYNWDPRPMPEPDQSERLRQHFATVERQLLRDSEASLDRTVERLDAHIRAGETVDRVVT